MVIGKRRMMLRVPILRQDNHLCRSDQGVDRIYHFIPPGNG